MANPNPLRCPSCPFSFVAHAVGVYEDAVPLGHSVSIHVAAVGPRFVHARAVV